MAAHTSSPSSAKTQIHPWDQNAHWPTWGRYFLPEGERDPLRMFPLEGPQWEAALAAESAEEAESAEAAASGAEARKPARKKGRKKAAQQGGEGTAGEGPAGGAKADEGAAGGAKADEGAASKPLTPLEKRVAWMISGHLCRYCLPLFLVLIVIQLNNYIALALIPRQLGEILDLPLQNGFTGQLWISLGILLGLVVLIALGKAAWQPIELILWMQSGLPVIQAVDRQAARHGRALRHKMSAGDVVTSAYNDSMRLGEVSIVAVEAIGALATLGLVGFWMWQMNPQLGLLVMAGMPLVLLLQGALGRPMQKRQDGQRKAEGELSTIATDAVAGLRILRGIGGEEVYNRRYREKSRAVRNTGYQVATVFALMELFKVLLPGVFLVAVLWVGTHAALAGHITIGQLVTFFGYTTFLTYPMQTFSQFIRSFTRSVVAVKNIARVLAPLPAVGPLPGVELPFQSFAQVLEQPVQQIVEGTSGAKIPGGKLTAIVCARPAISAALLGRLAGMEAAEKAIEITTGGQAEIRFDLRALTQAQWRKLVVYSGANAQLFTGSLGDNLDPDYYLEAVRPLPRQWLLDLERGFDSQAGNGLVDTEIALPQSRQAELRQALEAAAATEILEGLPDGFESLITEKGRSLSGGQRQRIALARALARRAPILALVEPTSAVDSHTEALIAQALQEYRNRSGVDGGAATTVITSASPLLLDQCEHVIFLDETGQAQVAGSHGELLQDERYRQVVHRGAEME